MLLINTQPVTIKDLAVEQHVFRRRIMVASAFVLFALMLLLVRMGQLQLVEHEHFRTLSENNRVKILPIEPTRGLIYDRNGVVLARNTPSFSLDVIPESVKDLDALIEKLRELVFISESDEARFRARFAAAIRERRPFDAIPLRLRLSYEEMSRVSVDLYKFPGVDVRARLSRDYPLGSLMAHVVGYVARINDDDLLEIDEARYRASTHIGRTGVERAYEDLLHGEVGYQHVETNAHNRVLRLLPGREDAAAGSNLYLSVDVSLQAAAEAALGNERGAVVAINPRTGGVLAMVSTPAFDPNLFVAGIDVKTYGELNQSDDRPLFNRVLYGKYPPGSTLKPFVGLAGLEFEAPTVGKGSWCPGFYQLKGHNHKYRDWRRSGHGRVDMDKAIVESCDVYFYELALDLGIGRMHRFLSLFGFGAKTGLDLGSESSGLMPSRGWKRARHKQPWYPGETLITGIGQGFTLTTPLQLASATATLANKGLRLQPQLVERIIDPFQGTEQSNAPRIVGQIELTNPSHWQSMIRSMENVVHARNGTAFRIAKGIQYSMAGKTGTAQVVSMKQDGEEDTAETVEKRFRDHALFVAFAPIERPRIAIAVVIENGGSGSATAAPIARSLVDHYLQGPDLKGPELQRIAALDSR